MARAAVRAVRRRRPGRNSEDTWMPTAAENAATDPADGSRELKDLRLAYSWSSRSRAAIPETPRRRAAGASELTIMPIEESVWP